jgi:hypothetical protein
MTDVATADREAAEAHADVQAAEAGIAAGRRKISPGKLVDLVTKARHADLTAQAAHRAAEQGRVQARATALTELGKQVDAAAAGAGTDIAEALGEAAAACARVRTLAAEHDARVAELADAALALGARGPVPGGVRRGDQGIAVTGTGGVRHDETVLVPVAPQLEAAIAHAVLGDVVSAQAAIRAVQKAATPKRADHYLRGRGGMVVTVDGPPNEHQAAQIRTGQLVELNETEILAYLDGERI